MSNLNLVYSTDCNKGGLESNRTTLHLESNTTTATQHYSVSHSVKRINCAERWKTFLCHRISLYQRKDIAPCCSCNHCLYQMSDFLAVGGQTYQRWRWHLNTWPFWRLMADRRAPGSLEDRGSDSVTEESLDGWEWPKPLDSTPLRATKHSTLPTQILMCDRNWDRYISDGAWSQPRALY